MERAPPRASGYRPDPPAADARVRWPASFGQRFTVMVDTEEEFDWSQPFSRDARATTAVGAIPAAAAWFADRGVAATWLMDYPVATSPQAREVLGEVLADARSALGTQLHSWVNPPLAHDRRATDSYAGNLPADLHAAKLDTLTAAIEQGFGRRPVIHRAGRYGIGPDTLRLLAERGYRFDCSMRARYDYSAGGGPDFRAIGNAAFRCGPGGAIVELPFTTIFTGHARAWGPRLSGRLGWLTGPASRARLLSRISLTPEDMPLPDVLEAIRVAAGEGPALLNFSFHSPSLVPGHTPYVRDARDLARFWAWWDAVLNALARAGIGPATLAEIDAATAPLA